MAWNQNLGLLSKTGVLLLNFVQLPEFSLDCNGRVHLIENYERDRDVFNFF